MKTRHLYRVYYKYPELWSVEYSGSTGIESHHFFIGEGHSEGLFRGRFRCAAHPRRRSDGIWLLDLQGVIEAEDSAIVLLDYRGYGRPQQDDSIDVVGVATHITDVEEWEWVNRSLALISGLVRPVDGEFEISIDVAEVTPGFVTSEESVLNSKPQD